MFCSQCGNKIENIHNFCSKCGNKISPTFNSNINTYYTPTVIQTTPQKKTNTKKIFIGLGIAVSIVLTIWVVYGMFSNIVPKRVDFDLKYDRVAIQEFMDIVCKNADVELAQVGRVGYDGGGLDYGTYYAATLTVKPRGMVAEEIQVRFYNSGDTDDVSSIVVHFYDHDSENEAACRDAIVEALEVSFCGSSKAKEYTSGFSSMGTEPATYETQFVTDYSLTDDAHVRITWREWPGSPMFEWTGTYCIYKQ